MTDGPGDIFDRLMTLPVLRLFEPFYRAHREVLLYLFFGGLTFAVGVGSFAALNLWLKMGELSANAVSWVLAVSFAFLTNRVWVFSAPTTSKQAFWRQLLSFFGGRAVTLVMEEAILAVFITWLHYPSMPVKIVAQIIVILANYIISKLFVFRRDAGSGEGGK